ncbi:MAG TPA: hypothetical protein VGW38_13690 [Chloroflexota bacterium]|nr:hypothetical protein [Chloroflexota bacterium]
MASTFVPFITAKPGRLPRVQRAARYVSDHVLFLAASIAFLVSAAALIVPQVVSISEAVFSARAPAREGVLPSAVAAPSLTAQEIETVLSYARTVKSDDRLVMVRPGVYAKRSNVEGVDIGGRTVFYDVLLHQSYGPLRRGTATEQQISVLARTVVDGAVVLVYTTK